jgi:hypothetical protein
MVLPMYSSFVPSQTSNFNASHVSEQYSAAIELAYALKHAENASRTVFYYQLVNLKL